jgi:hypothetical protein
MFSHSSIAIESKRGEEGSGLKGESTFECHQTLLLTSKIDLGVVGVEHRR